MTSQLTLFDAKPEPPAEPAWMKVRNEVLSAVETKAGVEFMDRANEFVLAYLQKHGATSGEVLTDECKKAGIVPVNGDRAFGAVFGGLSRKNQIVFVEFTTRTKGHGTGGAIVWNLP